MAWHHIIPCAVLIAVWNRLVDQHLGTAIPEARTAIAQYLRLCDGELPNVDQLVDRMRVQNTTQRRAGHNPLRALDDGEVLLLQSAAVWPAWNVVQGPDRRSDDPHDRYLDRFTNGLTAEEARRMRAVEMLFEQLQRFLDSGMAPGPAGLRGLAVAASVARAGIGRATPIPYRADMWVTDRAGLWRKNR